MKSTRAIVTNETVEKIGDWCKRMMSAKRVDMKIDDSRTGFEVMLEGFIGQHVAAKFFDVPWDDAIYQGGDPGHDLVVEGVRVEVKTTRYDRGSLLFNDMAHFKAPLAVLVGVKPCHEGQRVAIYGWVMRERFAASAAKLNFGHGLRLAMTQASLSSALDLRAFIKATRQKELSL